MENLNLDFLSLSLLFEPICLFLRFVPANAAGPSLSVSSTCLTVWANRSIYLFIYFYLIKIIDTITTVQSGVSCIRFPIFLFIIIIIIYFIIFFFFRGM